MSTTNKLSAESVLNPSVNNLRWFDEYLAGVNYDERSLVVGQLSLRQPLFLKPEPDNPQDAGAIRVETRDGKQVGYLRREVAASLGKYFENRGQPVEGVLRELSCDANGSSYRVRITFGLPSGLLDSPGIDTAIKQSIDYLYDESDVHPYVLLNCSDDSFSQIREKLTAEQIPFTTYGLCYRPASNGRQYEWYVRLERKLQLSRMKIEEFFKSQFNVEPDPLEQERHRLESEMRGLQAELLKSRKERDDYEALAEEIDSESGLDKQRLKELQNAVATAALLEVLDPEQGMTEFPGPRSRWMFKHSAG